MDALAHHFEQLYRTRGDPWQVSVAWYERRKRALLLAALSRARYGHAFEAGCGAGDMTVLLAQRCDRVSAVDVSTTAAFKCRERADAQQAAGVAVRALRLPEQWPAVPREGFDLAVVSEVAYYFDDDRLARFLARLLHSLKPGAELIACHWRRDFADRLQPTDALHQRIAAQPGLSPLLHHLEDDFRLDAWHYQPLQEPADDRRLHPRA
ncbi:methyltransferase type 12 [Streptomyces cavourensis]|nr:methyltransferase type 12 [Streptomyces cavourensis]